MSDKISAVEESPGVVSMMRWGLRATIYIYGGTTLLIAGTWAANAIVVMVNGADINGNMGDFHWIPGVSIMTAAGAMKGFTEWMKTVQKRSEISENIQEKQIQSDQEIQQGITETAKVVSK